MKPFKKILVPVDFSRHSAEAIRFAGDLSRRYDAVVQLVHVYQPVNYTLPEGIVFFTPAQLTSLLDALEKLLAASRNDAEVAGAPHVETKLLQGLPSSEIVSHAREGGFDLIVMGTHGRTGVRHAIMGSVAERVVRRAPCPVLTVHLPDQQDARP
jgi:nucleotide-binding universal stress UspA family protein